LFLFHGKHGHANAPWYNVHKYISCLVKQSFCYKTIQSISVYTTQHNTTVIEGRKGSAQYSVEASCKAIRSVKVVSGYLPDVPNVSIFQWLMIWSNRKSYSQTQNTFIMIFFKSCTMNNKCTINSQIIKLLHVSTL